MPWAVVGVWVYIDSVHAWLLGATISLDRPAVSLWKFAHRPRTEPQVATIHQHPVSGWFEVHGFSPTEGDPTPQVLMPTRSGVAGRLRLLVVLRGASSKRETPGGLKD